MPDPTPKGPPKEKESKIGEDENLAMKYTFTSKGVLGDMPSNKELLSRSQRARSNSRHSSLHSSIR